MSKPASHDMRFIFKIHNTYSKTFVVRIREEARQSFNSNDYKGILKAKKAAKKYRDKQEKIYNSNHKAKLLSRKKNYNECVYDIYDKRRDSWSVRAIYNDGKKQKHRSWSVDKYGYEKAEKLAYQWRDIMRRKE